MTQRLVFGRVGWMRWYRGPQPDDEKPIGGGKYNETDIGSEAYNFLPVGNLLLGYFQPQLQPPERIPRQYIWKRLNLGSGAILSTKCR
jgi:hypothetical protein